MATTPASPGNRKDASEGEFHSLLAFHSPSSALSQVPLQRGTRSTTWVVASMSAAFFAASALVPIDKVVTAQGRIVAERASTVVQPLETAIVRSIEVREGDRVSKGQLLARLDPTFATADLGALVSQVDSLRAEVDRLQAEADGKPYVAVPGNVSSALQASIYDQRKAERGYKEENYQQKEDSLRQQVRRASSDAVAYAARLKVAEDVENRRAELKRLQVGSALNLLQATDSKIEVRRSMEAAAAQASQADRDLRAEQAEHDSYVQNWKSQVGHDLTEQGRKLSDATENLKKAELRRQLVELRADSDGTVLSVARVSPGSVMQSGEQLVTLVPYGAPLEAEVDVAGADAGFVRAGESVDVKLDTLPYAQHGTIDGTIRTISADSFVPGQEENQRRPGSPAPRASQAGAFYKARVTLVRSRLRDKPDGFAVVPGMPVTADVKVGKRTLVGYLLGRVLPVFSEGMREP